MVIHINDPVVLMSEGSPQSGLGSRQPMLHSTIEIESKAKDAESPNAHYTNVQVGHASAIASDGKPMDDSAMNENASIQRQRAFDSKLDDLERMLVVRRKIDPDSPKAFDDIIRTQIETLVAAFSTENRESSFVRFVERLAGFRKYFLFHSQYMDHNGWNRDRDHACKVVDDIMAELVRVMNTQSDSGLVRDLDPLTALESLSKIKHNLFDKYGLEKDVEALIEQKIRALSLVQYSQNQTVDAFNYGQAEAMQSHRVAEDRAADLERQGANLKMDLEQAKEKVRQAESQHFPNAGNVPSKANAWSTPISVPAPAPAPAPAPTTPATFNAPYSEALRAPVEADSFGPPVTGSRATNVAMSSYPHMIHHRLPTGPEYAAPSGLFGSPVINSAHQSHYHGYGDIGRALKYDDRSSFGSFNTGFRQRGTQIPPLPVYAPTPSGFPAVEQTGHFPSNSTNVWPATTAGPPNAPIQSFSINETHKQMREGSMNQPRGQHGLTRANQGSRRREGARDGCKHHERGDRGFGRGRASYERDGCGKPDGGVFVD